MNMHTTKEYSGVVVPVITPLNQDKSLDVKSFRKLLQHLIKQKVDIFIMGTSSEIPRLSYTDKIKTLTVTMEECYGKVKSYMGILESGLKNALEDVNLAKDSGISCLVVCPPYYFGVGSKENIFYFTEISEQSEMPTILYNIPQCAGTRIADDVYDRMLSVPNVVGVKDSCGSLKELEHLIEKYSSAKFSVFAGSEDITYAGMKKGADGMVPSLGNAFPRLFADFYQACLGKDYVKAEYLNTLIAEFNAIKPKDASFMSAVANRKYALSVLDICQPYMTDPYTDIDEAAKKQIKAYINKYSKDIL